MNCQHSRFDPIIIYAAFCTWFEKQFPDERLPKVQTFGSEMSRRFRKKLSAGSRHYCGILLKDEEVA